MPRRALLGNWYEEEAYAADRRRLMQGRQGGSVDARHEVARVQAKCAHHLTPVALARARTTATHATTGDTRNDKNNSSNSSSGGGGDEHDGWLRFYAPVQLRNACTCGVLSIDLDDRQRTATGWQVLVSTDSNNNNNNNNNNDNNNNTMTTAATMHDNNNDAPAAATPAAAMATPAATLRNTFVLVPAAAALTDSLPVPRDEADVVHYGQPFYLMTMPALCAQALSLLSEARSPSSASNVTASLQRVYASPDGGTASALWCVDYVDAAYQEDMRDRPVRADAVVLLRHHMTSSLLASLREAVYYNDFGAQHEVGCGRLTAYASKRKGGPYRSENYWTFVHDDSSSDNNNNDDTPAMTTS